MVPQPPAHAPPEEENDAAGAAIRNILAMHLQDLHDSKQVQFSAASELRRVMRQQQELLKTLEGEPMC